MKTFISKKIFNLGVGIIILALGIVIGASLEGNSIFVSQKGEISTVNSVSPEEIFVPVSGETLSAGVVSSGNLSEVSDLAKVVRVIDGDTIEIEGGEKVRYIGIDTPETVDPRKPIQCFGVEASKKNKELVEGKMARLEKDITDRDKYNRLLRYVWIGDTLINQELAAQGFAKSYSYPPDVKYQDRFVAAEKKAREDKLGLWSACPSSGVAPTATSANMASSSDSNSNSNAGNSCQIKGNISASGEKIYHLPGCGSYTKTQIDEARGEKWFCSESEAQSSGWRKAGNCQ